MEAEPSPRPIEEATAILMGAGELSGYFGRRIAGYQLSAAIWEKAAADISEKHVAAEEALARASRENEELRDALKRLQEDLFQARTACDDARALAEENDRLRAELEQRDRAAREATADGGAKLWALVRELSTDECDSVEIVHPNADFDGPSYRILCEGFWVSDDLSESRSFDGESYLECLEAAVAAKREHGDAMDAEAGT